MKKFGFLFVFVSLLSLQNCVSAEEIVVQAKKPFSPEEGVLDGLHIAVDAAEQAASESLGSPASPQAYSPNDWNVLTAVHLRRYTRQSGARATLLRRENTSSIANVFTRRADRAAAVREASPHLIISIAHAPLVSGSASIVLRSETEAPLSGIEKRLAEALKRSLQQHLSAPVQIEMQSSEAGTPATIIPSLCIQFDPQGDPPWRGSMQSAEGARDEAIVVYRAIVETWAEAQSDLDQWRQTHFPDAEKSTERPRRQSWRHETSEETGRGMWRFNEPPQNRQQAQILINSYLQSLSDTTFFHLEASAEKSDDGWILQGSANYPRLKDTVEKMLQGVGCSPIDNQIVMLPSPDFGELLYGLVIVPTAFSWGEPREGTNIQTQLLLGDWVFLLKEDVERGFLFVHGSDGYLGWVKSDAIVRIDEEAFLQWRDARRVTVIKDSIIEGLRLPAGASLPLPEHQGGFLTQVLVPTDAQGATRAVSIPSDRLLFPKLVSPGKTAVLTALDYLATPYVFGGRSRLGIDCSGLTGISYATLGLVLPRDARQQILVGQMVATPWSPKTLQAGDLIFFCNEPGRVTHTGLSLGGLRFVHASDPEVQVNSFDPNDPLYKEELLERFAFARRPVPW